MYIAVDGAVIVYYHVYQEFKSYIGQGQRFAVQQDITAGQIDQYAWLTGGDRGRSGCQLRRNGLLNGRVCGDLSDDVEDISGNICRSNGHGGIRVRTRDQGYNVEAEVIGQSILCCAGGKSGM